MPEIIQEPITKTEIDRLMEWFGHPGASIFFRLVESEILELECDTVRKLMLDTEKAEKSATHDALRAVKTKFALELFNRYRAEKKFHTSKAIPSTVKL